MLRGAVVSPGAISPRSWVYFPARLVGLVAEGAVLPVTRRQKVFSNGTLLIQQARQGEDQGTYTCQAVNRQKHSARRDVEVAVQSECPVPPLRLILIRLKAAS